jgi:hypothetical protein
MHLTAINTKWLLDRDGELAATFGDGRGVCLRRSDLLDIVA